MSDVPMPPTQNIRSIMDRMTKPAESDRENVVRQRLATLSFQELDRMVDHFTQAFNHLASCRDDLTVEKTRDEGGWTIRLSLESKLPNPLIAEGFTTPVANAVRDDD